MRLRPTLALVGGLAGLGLLPGPALAGQATGGGASGDPDPAVVSAGGASPDGATPIAPVDGQAAGGAQYDRAVARKALVDRPVATLLGVGATIAGGASPRIRVRIDERGERAVHARIVVLRIPGNTPVLRLALGRVPTGRLITVSWPRTVHLDPGQYLVRLHAKDRFNHNLQRLAQASGRATLVVGSPPAATPTAPAPVSAPSPTTPAAGTVLPGGTFPVQGSHTFGDPFGTPRKGYTHQGVDVLAAEGTPIVAPVAGTITVTSYQAGAAGYYVVEQAQDGRSFFFAHCQKDSFGSQAGQVVPEGAPVCRVGQTGDATGPHLHFEEWLGGWRVDSRSHPVDPMPQLQAWDRKS